MEALKSFRSSGNYSDDVENDFRQMEPHFPENVESIVDIGCGLAGIDVLLRRKFPFASIKLWDDSGHGVVHYWNQSKGPYGDRKAAEALLEANGVRHDGWLDGNDIEADLVISTLAWGFHFPLSTFNVSGFCIADLRKGKEGPRGKIIAESQSYYRCAFQCSK